MNDDNLPDWSFHDNYTGPYWSDGKFQKSTSKGKSKPASKLDKLSKTHDASYDLCGSYDCLDDADQLYYEDSRNLSFVPRMIGYLPKYGNYIPRLVERQLFPFNAPGGAKMKLRGSVYNPYTKTTSTDVGDSYLRPIPQPVGLSYGPSLPNSTYDKMSKQVTPNFKNTFDIIGMPKSNSSEYSSGVFNGSNLSNALRSRRNKRNKIYVY